MEKIENESLESTNSYEKEEVYSESFRAGKRTYFFDVKEMKNGELYITITESKRKLQKNGKFIYEKHHVYLYKEDFDKFVDTVNSTVNYVKLNQPVLTSTLLNDEKDFVPLTPILDFEDLDK